MNRKGFEKSINVVITIVVLLVVALAVITLVLNSIDNTNRNIRPTTDNVACNLWKRTACGPADIGVKTHPNLADCDVRCDY